MLQEASHRSMAPQQHQQHGGPQGPPRGMISARSASRPLDLPPYSHANSTLPTIDSFSNLHGTIA